VVNFDGANQFAPHTSIGERQLVGNPLVTSVVQVRFSDVPDLEAFAGRIVELLNDRYPVHATTAQQNVLIGPDLSVSTINQGHVW